MKFIITAITLFILCLNGYAENNDRGYIVKIGDKAPDIRIIYTDGTQKKLSDFKGKIVMMTRLYEPAEFEEMCKVIEKLLK